MFKMCWERLDPRFASHIQFQYYQIKKLLSTPRFSFFFQKKLKISIKNNNKKQNLLSERIVVERKMNRCRFVLSLLMWASLLGLIVLCFLFSPFSPSFNIIHYRIQGPKFVFFVSFFCFLFSSLLSLFLFLSNLEQPRFILNKSNHFFTKHTKLNNKKIDQMPRPRFRSRTVKYGFKSMFSTKQSQCSLLVDGWYSPWCNEWGRSSPNGSRW